MDKMMKKRISAWRMLPALLLAASFNWKKETFGK